jgi:hypothetical protein
MLCLHALRAPLTSPSLGAISGSIEVNSSSHEMTLPGCQRLGHGMAVHSQDLPVWKRIVRPTEPTQSPLAAGTRGTWAVCTLPSNSPTVEQAALILALASINNSLGDRFWPSRSRLERWAVRQMARHHLSFCMNATLEECLCIGDMDALRVAQPRGKG